METQGDFIRYLIKEVESAAFTDIEDVVPFVKWLDDELSYLVLLFLNVTSVSSFICMKIVVKNK